MNKFCSTCGNFVILKEDLGKCIIVCPVCDTKETINEDLKLYDEKTFSESFIGDLDFIQYENIFRKKEKMCPTCKKKTYMTVILDEETYERKFYCAICKNLYERT